MVQAAGKFVTINFDTRADIDRSDESPVTRQLYFVPVALFEDMARVEILRGNPEFRASAKGSTVRIHLKDAFTSAHEEVLKRHHVQRWRQEPTDESRLAVATRRVRHTLSRALARLTK